MRKQPAPPSPKPAQTDPATPSESRTTRHRADQSPVRNQRPGLPHTQIIGNTDDAILGKINDGQQVCWPPPSPTPTSATTSTPAASTPKPTPRSSSPSWKPCPARRSSSLTARAVSHPPPNRQPHTRGGKSADNAVSGERRAPKGRQRGRSPRQHPACRTHHPPASRTTMPYLRCSGSAGTLPHTWLRSSFVSANGLPCSATSNRSPQPARICTSGSGPSRCRIPLRTGRNSNKTPSDFSTPSACRRARLISALAVAELREITSAAATMARKPNTATVRTTISADEKSTEPSFEASRTTNG